MRHKELFTWAGFSLARSHPGRSRRGIPLRCYVPLLKKLKSETRLNQRSRDHVVLMGFTDMNEYYPNTFPSSVFLLLLLPNPSMNHWQLDLTRFNILMRVIKNRFRDEGPDHMTVSSLPKSLCILLFYDHFINAAKRVLGDEYVIILWTNSSFKA